MKFSLTLPDDDRCRRCQHGGDPSFNHHQHPILKAKLPLTTLSHPFTSTFVVLHRPSCPSLKLAAPPSAGTPFSLTLKLSIGLFGSPNDSPLVFSAHFPLSLARSRALTLVHLSSLSTSGLSSATSLSLSASPPLKTPVTATELWNGWQAWKWKLEERKGKCNSKPISVSVFLNSTNTKIDRPTRLGSMGKWVGLDDAWADLGTNILLYPLGGSVCTVQAIH